MRTLIALRHSKTQPAGPGQLDADRALMSRGIQDAMVIAEYLANKLPAPELVLCSSARRTRETLALLLPYLCPRPRILYEDGLYLASADALVQRIAAVEAASTVLLVGHNDGIHECVLTLAGGGDPAMLQRLATKFPIDAWAALAPGRGRLVGLTTPRELAC